MFAGLVRDEHASGNLWVGVRELKGRGASTRVLYWRALLLRYA